MATDTIAPPVLTGKTGRQLADELKALTDESNALCAAGAADPADLTDEQVTRAATLKAHIPAYREAIAARAAAIGNLKALADDARGTVDALKAQRIGQPALGANRVEAGESEAEKFVATGGFKGLGHFAHELRRAGRAGNESPAVNAWKAGVVEDAGAMKALFGDSAKAATGLNEFTDSEGGLLVPTQIAGGIWQRSIDDDFNLLSLMNVTPVTGKDLEFRALNDKSRADGSRYGGVQAYWKAEAEQYTASKPTFRDIKLSLNKLTVLVYATDELLDDAPAASSIINTAAASELRFKINDALIRGSGVGMPLGVLNAPAKVTVSRGTASHVTAVDLDNMYARRSRASGNGIVWLANQDIEPDLANLNYTVSSASAVWAYMPGGTFGSEVPRLKGKPTYYIEQAESLGTSGDLVMLDPSAYAVAVKSTGVKSAVSMHLRFDYDETVFKFSVRLDARPLWETSLTRFKGSNPLSPIVVLN